MFLHRVFVETLNTIPELTPSKRVVFDQRLQYLCENRFFRDNANKVLRSQKSIFESTGMTAADKVAMMFLMPHVLGHTADLIPPQYREPVLTASAHIQLVFIAVSGRRPYTRSELHAIFDRGYLVIFGCLEQIRATIYTAGLEAHDADPDDAPAPKRIKLQNRSVSPLTSIEILLNNDSHQRI